MRGFGGRKKRGQKEKGGGGVPNPLNRRKWQPIKPSQLSLFFLLQFYLVLRIMVCSCVPDFVNEIQDSLVNCRNVESPFKRNCRGCSILETQETISFKNQLNQKFKLMVEGSGIDLYSNSFEVVMVQMSPSEKAPRKMKKKLNNKIYKVMKYAYITKQDLIQIEMVSFKRAKRGLHRKTEYCISSYHIHHK